MGWRRITWAAAVLTVGVLTVTGCGSRVPEGTLEGDITIAYGRADSVELELSVASCNKEPRAQVEETTTDVRVRAILASPMGESEGDCQDSIRVTLRSPLANRRIVDSDGQPIPLAATET